MSKLILLTRLTLAGIILVSASVLAIAETVLVVQPKPIPQGLQINSARAVFNYQMNCLGCHTPNGAGGRSVPDLRHHLGYFLRSETGREYLARVPGAANSILNDVSLAEVLNWMLLEYAGDSLMEDWQPYQAEEVGEYRRDPLYEVVDYRNDLIKKISNNK